MAKSSTSRRGNNEGTIYKRLDGNWESRITIGYGAEGKPIRKSFYGKTREEVRDKMDNATVNRLSGVAIDPSRIRLHDWIVTYYEIYCMPNNAPGTNELYLSAIRKHIKPSTISGISIGKMQPHHMQKFLNDLTDHLETVSIKRIRNLIRNALEQAVSDKLIPFNPAKNSVIPKGKESDEAEDRELVYYSKSDHDKLVNYLLDNEKDRILAAMVLLAQGTGLRIGELLGLRNEYLDLDTGTLDVRGAVKRETKKGIVYSKLKTKKSKRTVPIPEYIIPHIKSVLKHNKEMKLKYGTVENGGMYSDKGFVFVTDTGDLKDPRNVRRAWERLCARIGIDHLKFHALRHTYATRLLEINGVTMKNVQELLGHESIVTTMNIYGHVTPETNQNIAAELNKMFSKHA